MDSNNFVNTGFTLYTNSEKYGKNHYRVQHLTVTNAKADLFFGKMTETLIKDDDLQVGVSNSTDEISIDGFINMTYSQLDLYELFSIYQAFARNVPPAKIDK